MSNASVKEGDTLYVEPGLRSTGTTTLNKRVVVIGPGYDLTDDTKGAQLYTLYINAEGTELIGLDLRSEVYVNNNRITIRNCRLRYDVYGHKTSNENAECTIHSCFVQGYIYGAGENNTDAWVLTNNIFMEKALIRDLDCATLSHNTFVVGGQALTNVTASIVSDNILFSTVSGGNPVQSCSDNTYQYNITSYGTLDGTNKVNATLSKILACTGSTFSEAYYQLGTGSVALKYATDGTDCGAFGGSDPYVKGGKTGEFRSISGEEETLSGQCGVNAKNVIKWRIDKATGTLYLEGSGRMASYSSPKTVPWYTSASLIRHIVFDNSIIEIGMYAFSQLPNLKDAITLPGQLKAIGTGAFNGTPITSVTFEQPLDSVGYEAFLGTNLSTLYMNTVWLPYGFGTTSVRGGSGKLTIYVPKGQKERYEEALRYRYLDSWNDYYILAESDYDCGWDEYYYHLQKLGSELSLLETIANTLSIYSAEKSMVSLLSRIACSLKRKRK